MHNDKSKKQLEVFTKISTELLMSSNPRETINSLLLHLQELIPHDKSLISFKSSGKFFHVSPNMTPEEIKGYEIYHTYDYTIWYTNQNISCVYRDSDLVNDAVKENSLFYKNWIKPMGMEYVCGNVVADEATTYVHITLLRKQEMGDFSNDEMFYFDLITQQLFAWFVSHDKSPLQKIELMEKDELFSLLTGREKEIVELILQDHSTKEISEMLFITYETTRKHIANIYNKLGVSTRVQLIRKLIK